MTTYMTNLSIPFDMEIVFFTNDDLTVVPVFFLEICLKVGVISF